MKLRSKLVLLAAVGILSATTAAQELEYYRSHLDEARATSKQCHDKYKAALKPDDQAALQAITTDEDCGNAVLAILDDEIAANKAAPSQEN